MIDSGKPFYQTPVTSISPYVIRFKSTKCLAHITGISTRPGTPLKQKQNTEVLPRRGAEALHILQLEETPTKYLAHVTKIWTTLGIFPLDNYVLPVLCPISDIIVTFLCFVFLYFSTSVIMYFIASIFLFLRTSVFHKSISYHFSIYLSMILLPLFFLKGCLRSKQFNLFFLDS